MLAQIVPSAPIASYRVSGIVTDPGGEPVNNAEVTVLIGGVPNR